MKTLDKWGVLKETQSAILEELATRSNTDASLTSVLAATWDGSALTWPDRSGSIVSSAIASKPSVSARSIEEAMFSITALTCEVTTLRAMLNVQTERIDQLMGLLPKPPPPEKPSDRPRTEGGSW